MEPSWQPDPTGRHQYRWWDGTVWSDVVADDGEEALDPYVSEPRKPSGPPRKIVVSTTPELGHWKPKDPTPWRGLTLPEDSSGAVPADGGATAGASGEGGATEVAAPEPAVTSTPTRIQIGGEQLDPTEQMPAPQRQPKRTVIDTTRNDLRRPDSTGPVYAIDIDEQRRPIGRWIAAALVVLGLVGGALYLWVFRGTTTTTQNETGVSTGKVNGLGDFYRIDIRLERGETVRFRVEGPANRDLISYFLAPEAVANAYATQYVSDMGNTSDLTDPSQVLETYTDARELFDDQDIRDAVEGFVKVKTVDRCCKGVADTWSFVAEAEGTYRIVVVEADGKDADIRLVIESLGRPLITSTEISDALLNESFFTDSLFFKSTDPYNPGGP